MSQNILINSVFYDGELAEVLFKPDNDDVVLNFDEITLPFLFEPNLLYPPREIYGTYTIKPVSSNCPYLEGNFFRSLWKIFFKRLSSMS